jgi:hypothetical protein
MKQKIIILSTIILSACISQTEIQLPDGGTGYNLDCSGTWMSWAECNVQANQMCPDGFTVISSNREKSNDNNRSMLIECSSKS